ncbi:MAG: YihY/virulence factor BrkB family protein [Candidatus Saccharibacteria bacterium]
MKILNSALQKIDNYQRQHNWLGFPFAVIKKYGEDDAGYQSALLTYYGFLSLFPLLLILTTVVTVIPGHSRHLQQTIIDSTTNYFPVLGTQLAGHVETIHKTGSALLIGILFALYGARGVADAFRHGVNHIWRVPRRLRAGFPKSLIQSLSLIIIGGSGFILASLISGFAAAAGRGIVFWALSAAINIFILFWLFLVLLQVSLPQHVTIKETRGGAVSAAIGLTILQSAGGYLLTRELKSLDAVYSYFAIALGMMFWIYLMAQTMYYSIEIASVKSGGLWPRGIDGNKMTPIDKQVYARELAKEKVADQVPTLVGSPKN